MNALARVWARFSWAIATFLAFLVVPAASWAHDDPSKTTLLQLSLDDSVYVQGQAILALVCLRNTGSDSLRDLGSMEPEEGRLAFRLLKRGTGEALRKMGTLREIAYAGEGLSVAPGGAACEVANLLDHFGDWPPKEEFLNRALGEFSLPPGNYEISCALSVRTGMNRRLGSLVVRSSTQTFRVEAESRVAPGEQLLDSLRGGATWTTIRLAPENQERCSSLLGRASRSPYLYQLALCASSGFRQLDVDSLLISLDASGVSAVRSGALLWLACRSNRLPRQDRLLWFQARRRLATNEAHREILETWERRLAQGKFYYP